jgi:GntR family transcriptional regulator
MQQHVRPAITLHEQLRETIREKIEAGIYAPGSKISSENELCQTYSLSRVTVRRALGDLVDEGLLVKRKGVGTFVSSQIPESHGYLTGSFSDNCRKKGMVPKTKIVSIGSSIPPADVAEALGETCEVRFVRRIRFADEEPAVLEIDYLPAALAFLADEVEDDSSLFRLLADHHLGPVTGFEDSFGVRLAGQELAGELQCDEDTPLLEVLELLSDPDGRMVYVNRQYIVTSRYTHVVSLVSHKA